MADIEKVIKKAERIMCSTVDRDMIDSFCEDVIDLLKEQEIVPYIDIDEAKCPDCKVKLTRQELLGDYVLFEDLDFYDYCPHCGKRVKWWE